MEKYFNMRTALKRIKKWLEAGKVGPQTGKEECAYVYADGSRCVLGAALTQKQIEKIEDAGINQSPVRSVIANNVIALAPSCEETHYTELESLQDLHDRACNGEDSLSRPEWKKFRKYFNDLKKKYKV